MVPLGIPTMKTTTNSLDANAHIYQHTSQYPKSIATRGGTARALHTIIALRRASGRIYAASAPLILDPRSISARVPHCRRRRRFLFFFCFRLLATHMRSHSRTLSEYIKFHNMLSIYGPRGAMLCIWCGCELRARWWDFCTCAIRRQCPTFSVFWVMRRSARAVTTKFRVLYIYILIYIKVTSLYLIWIFFRIWWSILIDTFAKSQEQNIKR